MLFPMAFSYRDTKEFSPAELEELFLSVQWESGRHPERLAEALRHYGAVFSAWDGDRLAGLAAAMDDGTMTAYVHYLLVHPRYQGRGIGSSLLDLCKKHYAGYLCVVLTSYREGIPFYERNGFIPDRAQEAMRFIPPPSGEKPL
ncbi:GNAT family N-acetyltransferase [Akkermansia muciniphila]|nr:GNAT family N-acetyltransferase [Akkermansia muciniphila]